MKRMEQPEECWADKNNVSVANCLLISCSSSSFAHYRVPMMLFSKPPKNKTKLLNVQAQAVAAHSMLAAAADNCLRIFHSLPFLNKLLSLPAHFHNFSKMQKENSKKVFFVSNHNFAAILPGDSVAGVVVANGILNFLNIYNTLLIVRLVLTWFPNSPPAIVSPLSTLCDPYLNIFRGIIPPLGGTLDLSPILAFLVLNAFTSTAAALPAELPATVKSENHQIFSSNLTSSQQKWTRRLFQSKTKNSGCDN